MDNILLIISDWSLRQLYHELLLSKHFEVIPIGSIENALMLLALQQFTCIVVYDYEEDEQNETETFLRLRKKHKQWNTVKLVLLSGERELYKSLNDTDLVLNPLIDSPIQVTEKITCFVKGNS